MKDYSQCIKSHNCQQLFFSAMLFTELNSSDLLDLSLLHFCVL